MATLHLIKIYPDGGASYGIKGVRGSFGVKPSLFADGVTPPATLTISDEGVFAAEGAAPVATRGAVDPERAAKIQKAADVAKERAEKAAERAKKAAERAAKLGPAPEGGAALTEDSVSEPVAQ